MSKTLHLFAKSSDLRSAKGTVGLLCEFAPDSPWLSRVESSFGPEVLLGSADAALAEVYPLVSKLLENSPSIEGFQPLRVFEESLLEQFSYIAQAIKLDQWIRQGDFSRCRFVSYSTWFDRLQSVREATGSSYEVVAEMRALESSAHSRALRRLWESRPGPAEFSRRVTPLWGRWLSGLSKRRRLQRVPRGGIWFYSTAYNFTKVGLDYEPFLPERMNYLVEDPATGGQRLREAGRDGHSLYAWARAVDIPRGAEVRSAASAISAAMTSVPLSQEENTLRAVFLKSEWWRMFLTRRLPFLIFNNRVLQRWYQSVGPEMIVVGNSGFERVLLQHEKVRGQVPVVMLQHGIMHWVYGVTDEPVDLFLLRGPFFQRVISESLRRKTVSRNLPELKKTVVPTQEGKARDSILFITAPYDVLELAHEEDRRDILRSLLRVSNALGRRLLIRVHPMEKVSAYQTAVAALQRELGLHADVIYSQGLGAEDLLARSSVAVLYFSTMFLDCLRHGIPIVSFGWHWFANRRHFEDEGVFNFARDLNHFEELVRRGVEGTLPRRSVGIDQFLAETKAEEISRSFQEIWETRKSRQKGPLHAIA